MASDAFIRNQELAKTWGVAQVALLIAVIGISVFKPKIEVPAALRKREVSP